MNERISELVKQTNEWFDEDGHSYSRTLWNEKFAELVVQECVGVADDYVKDCLCKEHIICNHPRSKIGIKIKEHFGVK